MSCGHKLSCHRQSHRTYTFCQQVEEQVLQVHQKCMSVCAKTASVDISCMGLPQHKITRAQVNQCLL